MGVVVKPGAGKGKGYVILVSNDIQGAPKITLKDGTVITGKLLNNVEGNKQYQFPTTLYEQQDFTLDVGGKTQTIKDGKQAYEGGTVGGLQPRAKGSIGSGGQIVGGEGLGGSQAIGAFGAAPQDISGEFPTAATVKPADYKFTDPQKFAEGFGNFNRENLTTNNAFSKNLALDNLDTELKGLKGFAPAAAALKRDTIATDNTFNQAQRTDQLASAVPDVLKDLDQQASDARSYASGTAPNSVIDKAAELTSRSASADTAATSGFGAQSSASRKLSDLQSAETRIGLSQYGNSLLATNAQARAALKLAPTEYSNAGQEISAAPSISGSQLQLNNFGATNAATLINADTGLSSNINQNQFVTSNENQINQFNANNLNNFALSLFNYKAGLANAVASAAQTSINSGIATTDQKNAKDTFDDNANRTRKNNSIKDVLGAVGSLGGVAAKAFGWSDERLKKDVEEFTSGLDTLLKIKPVSYKYNKEILINAPATKQIGVLAQDMLKIIPDSVGEATVDNKTFLTYDPLPLMYVLVNAVQELSKLIDDLEEKVYGKSV